MLGDLDLNLFIFLADIIITGAGPQKEARVKDR